MAMDVLKIREILTDFKHYLQSEFQSDSPQSRVDKVFRYIQDLSAAGKPIRNFDVDGETITLKPKDAGYLTLEDSDDSPFGYELWFKDSPVKDFKAAFNSLYTFLVAQKLPAKPREPGTSKRLTGKALKTAVLDLLADWHTWVDGGREIASDEEFAALSYRKQDEILARHYMPMLKALVSSVKLLVGNGRRFSVDTGGYFDNTKTSIKPGDVDGIHYFGGSGEPEIVLLGKTYEGRDALDLVKRILVALKNDFDISPMNQIPR